MKLTAEHVEEIVRSVLRELQPAPAAVSALPAVTAAAAAGVAAGGVTAVHGLVISEAVLSAAGVAGGTVSLQRGAVLTPSGRDYLRRHGVRVASQLPGVAARVSGGLVIQCLRSAVVESAAGAAGWGVETVSSEDAAISRVLQLHGEQPLVCVSSDPAVVVCLLNRRVDVRAAAVSGASDLQRLTERLRPTVVCLDGAGWSWTQLLRMLRMQSSVVRSAPAGWREVEQGAGR